MSLSSTAPLNNTARPSASRTTVTAKNALFTFYDIESLENAFTVASFTPRTNTVELFFLLDENSKVTAEAFGMSRSDFAKSIGDTVLASNPAFKPISINGTNLRPSIILHNLGIEAGVERLATLIGLYQGSNVNDPDSADLWGGRFRPVCDTDLSYDPINTHAYLAGYNSYAYDTTMLALFFHEALDMVTHGDPLRPVNPKIMREHNAALFSDLHRNYMPSYLTEGEAATVGGQMMGWNSPTALIRKAMLDSGRHIDVSRLNESQRIVGLKRLLGGLGRQILEADKLSEHNARLSTFQEFCELLAYNTSDVVSLAKLFEHPAYSGSFDLKKSLLDEYPETVYEAIRGTHRPNISQNSVRMGRLAPDSTSAKFVARILAPYKDLADIPAVSFMYPSERVATETGVQRRNVLEECISFFKESIDESTPAGKQAHHDFMEAMSYYQAIEGMNFNDAQRRVEMPLSQVPKKPNNLPYYHADGTPSSCFVTFSTGGIHGAEYDVQVYEQASTEIDAFNAHLEEIQRAFPDPLDFWLAHPGKKTYIAEDGTELTRSQVLTSATKLALLKERREHKTELDTWLETGPGAAGPGTAAERLAEFEQRFSSIGYRPFKKRPELFEKASNGSTKLKPQFTHTSAARVTHEDFTSYYPNMLRNMSAFYNPDLGEDRYAKIFKDKERYGHEMKQPGISTEEKVRLEVLRNGTKLILNSASGAGDTTHKNPIRMNNQIISMRIIGQLFSWRIGQAQTLAGARIVSTNTDGLYSVLDDQTNNRVLAEQAALIHVDIEPEALWLVSKDSNNRLELEVPKEGEHLYEAKIISASGGTLACHEQPQPTKSLAHPAVLDWTLARYLREILGGRTINGKPLSLDKPMDRVVARWLMEQARNEDPLLAARLFQNILAASTNKLTFPFATAFVPAVTGTDEASDPIVASGQVRALQHYNRVFVMKPGTPDTVSIQAAGTWVVNEASRIKRKKNGEQPIIVFDPVASPILEVNGWTRDGRNGTQVLPPDQDVAVRKVPRLDPEWAMRIDNRDLVELDPEVLRREILDHLDLDAYVDMLASTFEENWMNQPRLPTRTRTNAEVTEAPREQLVG